MPEGIYLRGIKQEDRKVNVSGWAASNERVSEFLRNLQNNSEFLERPELIEIKVAGADAQGVQSSRIRFLAEFFAEAHTGTSADAGAARSASRRCADVAGADRGAIDAESEVVAAKCIAA